MNTEIYWKVIIGTALTALLWTSGASGEAVNSPRDYCAANGGTTLETGNPDVHMCCYAVSRRCVAANDRSRTSVRASYPDDSNGQLSMAKKDRKK
ncbi:MAG: hypothetical protein WCZ87_10435 [Thiohalobacteraceae bacterium]